MDRHDAYVASSRSRGSTEFFVDRKAVEASARAELPLNLRLSHPIDGEAARSHLASRLARSGIKTTTLDVLTGVTVTPDPSPSTGHSTQDPSRRPGDIDRGSRRPRLSLD